MMKEIKKKGKETFIKRKKVKIKKFQATYCRIIKFFFQKQNQSVNIGEI